MEQKKTVMIAVSSEKLYENLTATLEAGDFEVVGTANDGNRAIELLGEVKPEFLVVDLLLPQADGISVIKAANTMEMKPVILVLTEFMTEYTSYLLVSLGVQHVLRKPCTCRLIAERLKEICEASESSKAWRHKTSLELMVTSTIHEIGVPANLKGYRYLREAILIAVCDIEAIYNSAKSIYCLVAERFHTNPAHVEHSIRHAVEVAWNRGDLDTLQRFFGYTVSSTKGKPTNSEFIALVADKIQIQLRAADKPEN